VRCCRVSDVVITTLFVVEMMIRVISQGFWFTKDAYLKSR
jgi:hypothetical protein